MLLYPDFTKHFDIHTDASNLQLGSVITQNKKKTIVFYSIKSSAAQMQYTTTEK